MKQSEQLHTKISQIADKMNCSFVDAVLEFCEVNLYDPEDIVKQMDDITKDRLKQSAIDERMVRKSVFAAESLELPLE
jgi:predicted nucleic acid-binding protein